jgi:sialate O-acetylesterase
MLLPRQTFGNYSITASCSAGCSGINATQVVRLVNLTFGDVYVCSGQSNMQLMMDYTFERNTSVAKIRNGQYQNIRLFYGPMNFDYGTNQTNVRCC